MGSKNPTPEGPDFYSKGYRGIVTELPLPILHGVSSKFASANYDRLQGGVMTNK